MNNFRSEEIAILQFIAKNRRYRDVGGNVLWKEMEKSKIVPGKSTLG
jgi:hypothetical protein